jgi:cytochrome c oxidase cbb3-type subunit 3
MRPHALPLARILGLTTRWAVLAASALAAPDGAELYRAHGAACHQTQGRGGIGLPLSRVTLANVSDDYLTQTIRLGRPGRIMPAFEYPSDAQVVVSIGYARSWYGDPGMTFDPAATSPRVG